MVNHELLLGTLRKKEFSKEIQGVVAAVLDSRVRVPNPVGVETVLRMVGRCGKVFELCNMGINIFNGDIVRLDFDDTRDWVAIHHTKCKEVNAEPYRKNIKDHTGFYLFSGLWNEGDALSSEPYGKCKGMLKRGMFPHVQIVGNISKDYIQYRKNERLL